MPPRSPEPTRERLVSEAMRLFAQRGFRGTRVGDIEAAAGLSPRAGAFYRHFKSKKEVLHAALDRYVSGLSDLEQLTSLIEPIMICVMGVIVGGMVLAIFLPIFEMQKALQQ